MDCLVVRNDPRTKVDYDTKLLHLEFTLFNKGCNLSRRMASGDVVFLYDIPDGKPLWAWSIIGHIVQEQCVYEITGCLAAFVFHRLLG